MSLTWEEPNHRNNYCHLARTALGNFYVAVDGGRHIAWAELYCSDYEKLVDWTSDAVVGTMHEAKAIAESKYKQLYRSLPIPTIKRDELPIPKHNLKNTEVSVGDKVLSAKGNRGIITELTIGKNMDGSNDYAYWIFWNNGEDRYDQRVSLICRQDAEHIRVLR